MTSGGTPDDRVSHQHIGKKQQQQEQQLCIVDMYLEFSLLAVEQCRMLVLLSDIFVQFCMAFIFFLCFCLPLSLRFNEQRM